MISSSRRSRGILYSHHAMPYFIIFVVILSFTLTLLFLGVIGAAFKTLFPSLGVVGTLLLLGGCLIGSYINVPITKISTKTPIVRLRTIQVFGITYYTPIITMGGNETVLAINVGGGIIPLASSIYLISKVPQALIGVIVAIASVAIIVKAVSRPVVGMGIVSPSIVPPLVAALSAILLGGIGGGYTHVIAYVSGTLGTLIGADLLNFKAFPNLGSPIISIGGAGTFDGIFLSGIVAVLIAF